MDITPSKVKMEDLLDRAIKQTASDLHLTAGRPPVLRINGTLVTIEDLPSLVPDDTLALARSIVTEAQWKEFVETRELDFSMGRQRLARFRVNCYWQRGAVAIALRAIPHEIPSAEELGLPAVITKFAMADHGLFIVTGPTGSGKSTTLAAMVNQINENKSCHIITLEDPIEYLHRHKKALVNQRELHQDTLSFHEAVRHVLRQNPDVILIGEMRDLETIQTCLNLAETGHLLLATLHTGDATQAITRIVDVYPPHQQAQSRTQLSLVLVGVMAQQLIRRKDGKGRALAFEVLTGTPAICHLIRSGEIQQVYSMLQTGSGDGMCTLNSSLLRLYRNGLITRDDAVHKTTRLKELLELMDGAPRHQPAMADR